MNYIYVISKKRKPLMPTTRQSHIRKLIRQGKAVVINGNPFTVRLKYDTPDIVQDLYLGMDTGRENIGEGASLEDGTCVYLAETETRNKSVTHGMAQRKTFRQERRRHARQKRQRAALTKGNAIRNGQETVLQSRRKCRSVSVRYPGAEKPVECKVVKGKEARFANRKRTAGWLTPSARHLIQMHLLTLQKTLEILPVSDLWLEQVSFDFQKLENTDIKDWNHGPLYGYKDYKEYIQKLQHGKCLLCGCGHIEEYHHIVPKSRGGSDTVRNIAGLCRKCHHGLNGVHKNSNTEALLLSKKEGCTKQYRISLLNTVMPYLVEEMQKFCESRNIRLYLTSGYETFLTREKYKLGKTHAWDGYAISLAGRENIQVTKPSIKPLHKMRFKKKSGNMIHKNGQRNYYLNGKLVAIGRHKAEGQTADSLEEFRNRYGEDLTAKLTVEPAKRTYTYHKADIVPHIHPGDIVRYRKYNKTYQNTKEDVFVAERVRASTGKVRHNGTKNKKLEYCQSIKSGCIQYI